MPIKPATILGGLPVMAEVSFTTDYWGEHDATVDQLYWLKRDGTAGKPISRKIRDRAEKYDYGLCNVIESVSEQLAYEASEAERLKKGEPEMVLFDLGAPPCSTPRPPTT
jgi:hypothetical protein